MSEEKDKKAKEKQREDLQKRVKGLNDELVPLLAKYKLALTATPFYIQTSEGFFVTLARPYFVDDSKPPVEPKEEPKVEKSDIAKVE